MRRDIVLGQIFKALCGDADAFNYDMSGRPDGIEFQVPWEDEEGREIVTTYLLRIEQEGTEFIEDLRTQDALIWADRADEFA